MSEGHEGFLISNNELFHVITWFWKRPRQLAKMKTVLVCAKQESAAFFHPVHNRKNKMCSKLGYLCKRATCAKEVTIRFAAREAVAIKPTTWSGKPSLKLEMEK